MSAQTVQLIPSPEAVMQILKNSISMLDFPTQLEYAIIGAVLLIGVMADELTKRVAARRKVIN